MQHTGLSSKPYLNQQFIGSFKLGFMPYSIIVCLPYNHCKYFILCNAIMNVPTAYISTILGGVLLHYTFIFIIFSEGVP